MKFSRKILFFVILFALVVGIFLLKERSKKQSLADLYYGGKCLVINSLGGDPNVLDTIGSTEGTIHFSGKVSNVCDHPATLERIRIFYYSDPDYKNLVNSDRTFVPSLPSLELKSEETVSFKYTLKIYGDELNGFQVYKLVVEE